MRTNSVKFMSSKMFSKQKATLCFVKLKLRGNTCDASQEERAEILLEFLISSKVKISYFYKKLSRDELQVNPEIV